MQLSTSPWMYVCISSVGTSGEQLTEIRRQQPTPSVLRNQEFSRCASGKQNIDSALKQLPACSELCQGNVRLQFPSFSASAGAAVASGWVFVLMEVVCHLCQKPD